MIGPTTTEYHNHYHQPTTIPTTQQHTLLPRYTCYHVAWSTTRHPLTYHLPTCVQPPYMERQDYNMWNIVTTPQAHAYFIRSTNQQKPPVSNPQWRTLYTSTHKKNQTKETADDKSNEDDEPPHFGLPHVHPQNTTFALPTSTPQTKMPPTLIESLLVLPCRTGLMNYST